MGPRKALDSMSEASKERSRDDRFSDETAAGRGAMEEAKARINTEAGAGGLSVETIVAKYEGALLRYATRLLNNAAAAQDVVQEAFIRLFRRWTPDWPDDGRLRQWLYRTAHNAAIDHIRGEQRRQRLYERSAEEQTAVAQPEAPAALDAAERKRLVLERIAELDPSEREVLLLRLQEGLSYAEIARVTGRRIGTVGCLLHTATRKLAESLRKAGVIGHEG